MEHIKVENSKIWIVKERMKTGVTSNIPLTQEAIDLLVKLPKKDKDNPKYKHLEWSQKGMIKCLTNQKYNKNLKELGALLGIK